MHLFFSQLHHEAGCRGWPTGWPRGAMRLMAMIQKNVGLAKRNPTTHSYASIHVTFGRRCYACLPYEPLDQNLITTTATRQSRCGSQGMPCHEASRKRLVAASKINVAECSFYQPFILRNALRLLTPHRLRLTRVLVAGPESSSCKLSVCASSATSSIVYWRTKLVRLTRLRGVSDRVSRNCAISLDRCCRE